MLEKLEHAALQKITIHNRAVQWYKIEKEIICHSTLFDVDHYSVGKDSTVFIGLFDTRETELKEQVKKLLERSDKNADKRERLLAKLVLQPWIVNENVKHSIGFKSMPFHAYRPWPDNLRSAYISTPFPPPKV